MAFLDQKDLNLEATELRLGLPGTSEEYTNQKQTSGALTKNNKRAFLNMNEELSPSNKEDNFNASITKKNDQETSPPTKTQVVGWPPVRSYRKNCLQQKKNEGDQASGMYVKVSMDGAPYLRKIDLNLYKGYPDLLKALEDMFKFTAGNYFVPTYEDKDGDWMLVGDVPWNMFINSCKKLRVMKGSEAKGLECGV